MTRRRRRCWSTSWSYMRALVVPCVCVCTSFSLISSVCVFVSDEELLRFAVEVEPKDGKREQNARHR